MKPTPIFKILSAVLLTAVVLYFSVQIYRAVSESMTTVPVYEASAEDAVELNGYLVRQEETFYNDAAALVHRLDEGERVGVGQVMAVAYDSSEALRTVEQVEAMELQLEQLEFALTAYLDPDAALKLDSVIQSDILTLRRAVSGGDYTSAADELVSLKGAVLKRDYTSTSQQQIETDIAALQGQIAQLRQSLHGSDITAPRNGTYCAVCDGYETVLTPSFLETATPAALESVQPLSSSANVGKLIYGDTWYYAAVITDEQASALKGRATVTLRFAKTLTPDVEMDIVSVGQSEGGRCVVTLSCRRYMAQTTLLRRQTAQLILCSYSGLHVPTNALRVSEEGVSGVYCVLGVRARFKPVEVVYQDGAYALVKPTDDAGNTLRIRSGDQVIVAKGELYDGKVIG